MDFITAAVTRHEETTKNANGRFIGSQVRICSPPPMIDAAVIRLMQGCLPVRDIVMERAQSAASSASESTRSALIMRIRIQLSRPWPGN